MIRLSSRPVRSTLCIATRSPSGCAVSCQSELPRAEIKFKTTTNGKTSRYYHRTRDVRPALDPFKACSGSVRSMRRNSSISKIIWEDRHFKVLDEVKDAVISQKPVVALETTIYTHGFPYPDNIALALDLEDIVRRNGGVPATIGILDGVARVGLSTEELTAIASSAGKSETMKVSRRDIPYILGMGIKGRKLTGGTTIAGTMFLAQRAGIKVFGTGGLGGVHRGGQDTMDISADLTELGRTAVAVISSGCKSFLDIPRTLEYLETQGAGVFTFAAGRTGEIDFPAFYTRDSGVRSPMVVQDEKEAAAIIFSQQNFECCSGLHFANPIPEEYSIPKAEIDFAIDQAVQEAADQGYHGHSNTPFILARIKELTKGNSISANTALIESNVAMATKVAVELSKLQLVNIGTGSLENSELPIQRSHFMPFLPNLTSSTLEPNPFPEASVLVLGSVAIDISCDYSPLDQNLPRNSVAPPSLDTSEVLPRMHTSNIAAITPSIGGVGHNVALAAHRAGGSTSVRLCSLIAEDQAGATILSAMKEEGLDTSGIISLPSQQYGENNRTAQYVAVNDANKDLVLAMADMAIFSNQGLGPLISAIPAASQKPAWIVVDTNWHENTVTGLITRAKSLGAKVAVEPVSVAKSERLFHPRTAAKGAIEVFPKHVVDLATPNQQELAAMHAAAKAHEYFESERWWQVIDSLGIPSSGARDRFVALTGRKMTDMGIPLQSIQLLPYIPTILTKVGAEGVLLTELLKPDDTRLRDSAAAPYILSRSTNGSMEVGGVYMRLFPAAEVVNDVVSVNGVGDTFLGVLIAGLAKGLQLDERLIHVAQRGAVMSLRSRETVSPELGKLKDVLDGLARDS